MSKICDMNGVRGGEQGFPVELWRDDKTGRLLIVAFNEAGYSGVEIELLDVVSWLNSDEGRKLLLDTNTDGRGARQ